MSVKTITITTDAYDLLAQHKGPKDSFTDVILRTYKPAKKRSPLWELVGIFNKEQGAEFEKKIMENRKKFNEEMRQRGEAVARALDKGAQ